MSQQIIGISGKRGSGKDLLGTYLSAYGYTRCPFAESLKKEVREHFGLTKRHTDGELKEMSLQQFYSETYSSPLDLDPTVKHFYTPREIMIKYGQFFRQFDPLWWVKRTFEQAEGIDKIVITDVRFQNEAKYIKYSGGLLVRLNRKPELNSYGVRALDDLSETDLDGYSDFDLILSEEYNKYPTDLEDFAREIIQRINQNV